MVKSHNPQLTINSFWQIFHDNIFIPNTSLTFPEMCQNHRDISGFQTSIHPVRDVTDCDITQ